MSYPLRPDGSLPIPVSIVDSTLSQGGVAIPVYGYETPPNNRSIGMPALRVKVLSASDLIQNGGQYRVEGRPYAMPVYTAPSNLLVVGEEALLVYPVNDWPESAQPTLGLLPNLVAWWEMDEESGNRADSHIHNLTLIDNGNVLSAAGIGGAGLAASFNSANFFSLADTPIIPSGSSARSWCGWTYWDSFTGHSDNLVRKWGAIPNREFYLVYDNDGEDYGQPMKIVVGGSFDGDNATQVPSSISPNTGAWYFWTWTLSGGTLKLSINGGAFTSVGAEMRDGNADIIFGAALTGRMAKVCVFDIALDITQVGQVYNSGSGITYSQV